MSFRLTKNNYYSRQANEIYMSASQFKAFGKCQAAALAEICGEYTRQKTVSLLVGSFVDAAFEGNAAMQRFILENPNIFKKDGQLRCEYAKAQDIVERIKRQPLMMECLSGQKQRIMTGTIGGVKFKIKMDSYRPGMMICDLKCMKDFKDMYIEGQGRMPWYQGWGYDTQGAIYREIVRQNTGKLLPFVLVAATKEPVSDLDVLEVPGELLDYELDRVMEYAPLYASLKSGLFLAERCGVCDYCKATKVLSQICYPENDDEQDFIFESEEVL